MAEDDLSQPEILLTPASLRIVREKVYQLLRDRDGPPLFFQSNGKLVRLRLDGSFPRLEEMTFDMLRSILDLLGVFAFKRAKGNRSIVLPPIDYARDLAAQPGWPEDSIPRLDGIITCPVFCETGELIKDYGYHRPSKLWLELDPRLRIPTISPAPTVADIEKAKSTLLNDVFADFPFEDQASRANTLAYVVTFFVRPLCRGVVPLASIDAPAMGTGKGLLADATTKIALGQSSSKTAQPNDEAEWRKAISAALVESPRAVVFDNLTGTIRSGALEQLLTCDVWTDRILGKTERLHVPNRTVWLATANNLEVAGDLSRRMVWIRLDARLERPYERDHSTFRHPDLLGWLDDHRGDCIWAVLILVQNWISKGRPLGSYTMGSFQSWVEVVGGILDAAGIEGFLANSKKQQSIVDDDAATWRHVCAQWWQRHGDEAVGVKALFDIVAAEELFPYVMSAETDMGKRQRLGHLLRKVTHRVFENYRILPATNDNSGRRRYQLEILEGANRPDRESDLDHLYDEDGRAPGEELSERDVVNDEEDELDA
jgi:hypothetical protein